MFGKPVMVTYKLYISLGVAKVECDFRGNKARVQHDWISETVKRRAAYQLK